MIRRSRTPRREGDAGFTLVEILVSLGILATVLPTLLLTFSNSSRTRAISEARMTAAYLIRDTLAELEAAGMPTPGENEGTFEEGARFAWETTVSGTETEGLYDAVATVTWFERGQEQRYSVRTYLADLAVSHPESSLQQGGQP